MWNALGPVPATRGWSQKRQAARKPAATPSKTMNQDHGAPTQPSAADQARRDACPAQVPVAGAAGFDRPQQAQAREEADADEADDFKPLDAAQAAALRQRLRLPSPWRIVGWQAVFGGLAVLGAALVSRQGSVALSALWGAMAVVLPSAWMAWSLTRARRAETPSAGVVRFLSLELVKIAASVAILAMAPKLVQPLSWPAMLVALVLCLKGYVLALLWRRP